MYYIKPSTSSSTPANQTFESEILEYFIIEELGIKFQVTNDLQDLTYYIENLFGEQNAILSSASLVRSDISTNGSACAKGGLGRISLYRQGDSLYNQTGYYYAPQDRCSESLGTENLQRDLLESLEKSFETSTTLSTTESDVGLKYINKKY